MTQEVKIIPKVAKYLVPAKTRHRIIYGGRGKGASWSIARILLVEGMQKKLFVLCVREVQHTIANSVKKILEDTIEYFGWDFFYKSTVNSINALNGTKFIFMGLQDRNADNVKSIEGINRCWVAEGQSISRNSMSILRPTLRVDDSVFWWDFNVRYETDPVYMDYIAAEDPNATTLFLTFKDNPWFDKSSLPLEMESDYSRSQELAEHIWEGKLLNSGSFVACPAHLVAKAIKNELPFEKHGEEVIGADIAHQGGDKIVFYFRKGNKVIDSYEDRFLSVPDTVRALKAFARNKDVTINIDSGNVGAAVADYMIEDGYTVNKVYFGGKPNDTKHYENIVTEMYFELKENLEEIDIPNDENLKLQLTQRKYDYVNGSRGYEVLCLESKREYMKNMLTGQKSPDNADALVLCFYKGAKRGSFTPVIHDIYAA